jgi:hypothetical protein
MTAKTSDSNGKKWEEKTGMGRGGGNLSDGQAAQTRLSQLRGYEGEDRGNAREPEVKGRGGLECI